MAAKLGPKIINDQLVLSLDAADANSYAGEPTTNNLSSSDVANANAAPNVTNQYSNIAVTKEVVNYSSDRPHVYRIKSTNATGYFSMGYNSSIQNQSGSVYAFSFDYKVVRADTGTGTNLGAGSFIVYGNGYKLPTASNIASNISSSEVELYDGWKRVTKTYTCGYTGYNQTRQDLTTGDAGDFEVLIDNIQFEDKTYSTPFADLTRPNQIDFITHGDVGSGTTFTDSSVNNLTLTSANGASHAGTGPFGGSAMSFVRASSQQITSPSNSLCDFGTGDFTIDFWFNMNSGTATNTRMHALNIGSGNSTNVSFDFNDSGYGIWLYWMSGGSNYIRQSGNYHNDGLWHHCAFVRDNGTCRLWIDGAYIGGVSYATQIGATQSLYIGSASGGQHWDGYIDEVRIIKGTALWRGANNFSVPTRRGDNGAWLDLSGNSYSGNLINGTNTGVSLYRDGQVIMPIDNAYLDFDGSDDYVTLGQSLNNVGSTASIEVWFKSEESIGSSQYNIMFGWGDGTSYYSNFSIGNWFGTWGDESIHLGVNSAAVIFAERSGHGKYHDGNWHHAVATIGANNYAIYVDGSAVTTSFYSGSQSTSFTNIFNFSAGTYSTIGSRPYTIATGGSGTFNGKIPLVRVYDKILTAAEVLNNYNTTKSRFN